MVGRVSRCVRCIFISLTCGTPFVHHRTRCGGKWALLVEIGFVQAVFVIRYEGFAWGAPCPQSVNMN